VTSSVISSKALKSGARTRALGGTMDVFSQYSIVRVKTFLQPPDTYDDWGVNRRDPIVGDTGTVVEVLHGAAMPTYT